jgi:VCBS repeat-containing protein
MGTTNAVVNPNVTTSTGTNSQTGSPGEVLTYTVTVMNTGDYTDTFTIDLSGNSWPTSASTSSVGPLAAGQSADVEIYVTVGASGSDTVTVTAISDLDNNISDSVDLTSMVGEYKNYMPAFRSP